MEWIPERVLQRYVKENKEKFDKYFNGTISEVILNNDIYPDLYFIIDGKKQVPVEVEWKTSNFLQHKHPPEVLIENNGMLFVCKIEKNCDVGKIKQVEIKLDDFEKWFEKNSLTLARETTENLKKLDSKRTIPKLWFTYLSFKGGGVTHFETALKHQVWGIQKNYNPTTDNQIKGIRKGDLVVFIGPGKNFPGRVNILAWTKTSFKGYFEKIRAYRVTSNYFYDESPVWQGSGKWKNEVFPHRFNFDRSHLIVMKNCRINKLGLTTKKELHGTVYSNIRTADPFSLVDIMHHAEPLDLSETKDELDHLLSL